MKQRGSAIIIAMLLIATVGAVAFGVAKLIFFDTSISTTYENGTFAYYAAESGIEEGFLRYKYNMNTQIPYTDWKLFDPDNKIFRSNINLNESYWGNGADGRGRPIADDLDHDYGSGYFWPDAAKEQIYDLRIGYLGSLGKPWFYHEVNTAGNVIKPADIFNATFDTGDYSFLQIPRDEARKFDLSNVNLASSGGENLNIGFRFIDVKKDGAQFIKENECKAIAEVKFLINGDTPALTREYKALTVYSANDCASRLGLDAGKLDSANAGEFGSGGYTNGDAEHDINQTPDIGYYYQLDNILGTVLNKAGATLSPSDKVVMTVKPLYYDADVFFITDSCNTNPSNCSSDSSFNNKIVTGPYTYITSIGYFGGVTRTLTANIDRQSGTLYDLYDYVFFQAD